MYGDMIAASFPSRESSSAADATYPKYAYDLLTAKLSHVPTKYHDIVLNTFTSNIETKDVRMWR